MTPEDARKLLGGYATGTLTEAERRALFEAALEDQSLFDELAGEESLRATLEDPAARAGLLAALDDRPAPWWRRWRPAIAVAAMAGVAAIAVVVMRPKTVPAPMVARVEIPAAPLMVRDRADMPVSAPQTKAPARRKAAAAVPVPAPAPAPPPAPAPKAAEVVTLSDTKASVQVAAESAQVAPPTPIEVTRPMLNRMFQSTGAPGGAVGGYPQQPSARSIFQAGVQQPLRIQPTAAVAVTGAPQAIAVRYSVLRREGEAFVAADPNELKQDDTLALRFTASANGYLSIDGAPPVSLTAMKPYTTAALAADQTEVKIVFARTPQTTVTTAMAPLTEAVAGEVYVANGLGGPLGFTIQLTRK